YRWSGGDREQSVSHRRAVRGCLVAADPQASLTQPEGVGLIRPLRYRMTPRPMATTKAKAKRKPSALVENVKTIIYAGLIALVVRTLAFEPFNIPSGSMLPTLLIGDYLF